MVIQWGDFALQGYFLEVSDIIRKFSAINSLELSEIIKANISLASR
jgi:hypothetical protein